MPKTLRTLVVDDSIIFRKVVRDCLKLHPRCEIVDIARDGETAIEKIRQHKPDLVTLDYEMPRGTGLDVLEAIKNDPHKPQTILLSAHAGVGNRGGDVVGRAIALGATDYLLKPDGNDCDANLKVLERELTNKINAILNIRTRPVSHSIEKPNSPHAPIAPPTGSSAPTRELPIDALCIGISTGGPAALAEVMPQLDRSFPIPILIVQHMPAGFTKGLADHLDATCALNVHEAAEGMQVRRGNVYIAPGGKHMGVVKMGTTAMISINENPPIRSCRPSVDYLFDSAAAAYRNHLLALVMTGMGNDGVEGAKTVKQRGGHVWTQSAESCVVYGMPRAVQNAELSDRNFSLQSLVGDLNCAAARKTWAQSQTPVAI